MQIANKSCMAHGTVVLLGTMPIERFVLDGLVSEFGFLFKKVEMLQNMPNPNLRDDVIAVLFNPSTLGLEWDEALRSVVKAFPK